MKVIAFLLLLLGTAYYTPSVLAAKPRVRSVVSKAIGGTASTGYSKAKLSRNTNSVVVTFLNLGSVSRVTYTLSYAANGVDQGAVGSIVPSGSSTDTRDLYFGTCSHAVCTPHRGIQNASLVVEAKLKSGKTSVKRYRIKI